jgi:isovaleryl-CoA dehydrogenase
MATKSPALLRACASASSRRLLANTNANPILLCRAATAASAPRYFSSSAAAAAVKSDPLSNTSNTASAREFSSSSHEPFNLFTPSEEHAGLRETVRQWTLENVEPQAIEFNRDEKFNYPLFKKMAEELGILGCMVDEKYGGAGFDPVAACIIHEELSYSDPGFCLAYLAHSMLFVHNLFHNGSEAQKLKYLPRAISGELLGGMGMSEPGAGTDVLGLQTKATLSDDGKFYTLSGNKMWITNGCKTDTELGDVYLVYARTGERRQDISLFLIEKGMEGENI